MILSSNLTHPLVVLVVVVVVVVVVVAVVVVVVVEYNFVTEWK